VAVSASQPLANRVEVTFSEDLASGMLDAGNWTASTGVSVVNAMSAEALPPGSANVVRLTMASIGTFVSVTYSPPPFDVVAGAGGAPAAGFAGLAVT
jgi:hypothetical protein